MRGLLLSVFVVLLSACIDELNIDLPEATTTRRVVEGSAERDANDYAFWAQVSETQSVTAEGLPQILSADLAIVYNNEHIIQLASGTTLRIPIDEFHAAYGGSADQASFHLTAQVGGDLYVSEPQIIMPVAELDSLSVDVESRSELNSIGNTVQRSYVNLLVHTPFENQNGVGTSLLWTINGAYSFLEAPRPSDPFYEPKICYVKNNLFNNVVAIANQQEFSGLGRVSGLEIAETGLDFRFSIAYYFTVVQKSLNAESIEYWEQVKASNERSGTIYDVFPGQIVSNISNEVDPSELVNGFFHASAVDTTRLFVKASDVEFPRQLCAFWEEPEVFDPDNTDPCFNCLELGFESSLIRPHYWFR